MNDCQPYRRRRVLLAASAGAFSLLTHSGKAAEPINAPLVTAAIKVRSSQSALLEAVTRTGNRLIAVGEHGLIIYSDDSGETWTQGSVPVDVTLTCIAFATAELGWAAGHYGVILNTKDGGSSWQMQLNGIQANQLALDAADAVGLDNPSPGARLALKRANLFVGSGPSRPFLSLLPLSPQKVIVFGAYRMTVITADAGATWVDWSLHVYDALSHNLYDAALAGSDIYVVGEEGLVFKSIDGGETFLPVTPTPDVTLFGVLAATSGAIMVFGVAGSSFRSTDGGGTWTPIALSTQNDLTVGRVLKSGAILIASEVGELFMSKDNGVSFSTVSGVPPMSIYDMEVAPDNDLIFVGSNGVVKVSSTILDT